MFSPIYYFFKRLLFGPPKGEGRYLRIYIAYDIKSGATPKKLKKFWQKYFRGTEFCYETSGEFSEFEDEFSVCLSGVPGILGYEFIRGCKKGNKGFLINSVADCTEQVLRQLDKKKEILQLKEGIQKDMKEDTVQSLERANEKKSQLQRLTGGGGSFTEQWIIMDDLLGG